MQFIVFTRWNFFSFLYVCSIVDSADNSFSRLVLDSFNRLVIAVSVFFMKMSFGSRPLCMSGLFSVGSYVVPPTMQQFGWQCFRYSAM